MLQDHSATARTIPAIIPEPSSAWSARRKLLTILAAAILAWVLWGGAGLLLWRALA
jgi:hypothetical protein